MSRQVVRVVRQRAKRERVFVHIRRLAHERLDEVSRPDVVQQVAEEMTAERVVAEILNHRTAVRIRPRAEQTSDEYSGKRRRSSGRIFESQVASIAA